MNMQAMPLRMAIYCMSIEMTQTLSKLPTIRPEIVSAHIQKELPSPEIQYSPDIR